MLRPIALTLVLLAASPALALDCKNATTQADMNDCAGQSFKAADAALNETYGTLTRRVTQAGSPDAKSLLVTAQRDWLAFRDAECAFQASGSAGGSAQPMVILGCREDLTRKRTAALKAYLTCEEGDLACPAWAGK